MKYAFMKAHRDEFRLLSMCRVLKVHRSGYYAWLKQPVSARGREDLRLLGLIRQSWQDSGGAYGSPRITDDLKDHGELVSEKRVARIMREHRIRALGRGPRRRYKFGKPAHIAPNRLEQDFLVNEANRVWSTDITQIRIRGGWLYLCVVLDLYSRKVVGWSMKTSLHRQIVLDALMMAIWRRRPKPGLIIHSDQGSQYGSKDWVDFCNEHGIDNSMSRRGNCYDNAVSESFFANLKKERIRGRKFNSFDDARAEIFEYIEAFYNRKRKHGHCGNLSPEQYEAQASQIKSA